MVENLEYEKILKKLPFGYTLHKVFVHEVEELSEVVFVDINDLFQKFTKLDKEKIIGRKLEDVFPEIKNDNFDWVEYYSDVAINDAEYEVEQYIEEVERWYKIKLYSPEKYYVVSCFIDITNEIKRKELFESTLLSIAEGIIATDLEGKVIMINKTAERITEWEKDDILNEKIFDVFKVCDSLGENKITENILKLINKGTSINETETLILKSKSEIDIPIVYNISPVKDLRGEIYGMVVSFRDITERIIKEKELDYITYHDGLTGAYNRNFFNEEIKKIDIEENLPISVIMGDVNGLKLTNDAFGHLIGDKLLVSAANIMKKVCRENDIVVRWGGDEFIILLPKTKEKDVAQISKRIREECIKENVEVLNVSISLGYDTKNTKEFDIMKSITNAEEMMYKIKMLESKKVKNKTLKMIIKTLYEKSKVDDSHSKSVGEICKLMGESMNMPKEKISELEVLGSIHDVGKIGISESILNNSGKLDDEEWDEVKKHPRIGYIIASSSSELAFLGESVLAHHEWYDGSGYPKGLKGEAIPLMARILCIVDAYEAMTSYRPYRQTRTKNEAIEELKKYSGIQFDPKLVDVFIDEVVTKVDLVKIVK